MATKAGKFVAILIASGLFAGPMAANAQMDKIFGNALDAATGGRNGGSAAAIIGVAMASIIQQLTAAEQEKRQAALEAAARKGRANWSTKGKSGKKASYQKVGKVESVGGKQCQKVKETITLPDGKQGTSVETVCFS